MPATPRDPRLLLEVEQGDGMVVPLLGGIAFAYSARCPGKSRPNEDAAAIVPVGDESALLVVADGLGGQPGADQASGIAVRGLAGIAAEPPPDGELDAALLHAIEQANVEVGELGVGAGTTLVAAALEVGGELVRSFHVGDSMALVVSREGQVKLATVPHSPIGYALEAGLITEEQAMAHPDRHIISNMVGSPDMRIEVGPSVALGERDTLLLASDGVTDNLYFTELVDLIRDGDLASTGTTLARVCAERMAGGRTPCKPDDLTFLLYRRSAAS